MSGLNQLVDKIRATHPGAYDDMDDATLTKRVLAKYPQYSDLAAPQGLPHPEPQSVSPLGDTLESEAGNIMAHPGQAAMGALKEIPRLAQGALPQSGTLPNIQGDNSGKMRSPMIENAFNKASGFVQHMTQPQTPSEETGSRITDAAAIAGSLPSAVRAASEIVPAVGRSVARGAGKAAGMVDPDIVGIVSPRMAHAQRVATRVGNAVGRAPVGAEPSFPGAPLPETPAPELLHPEIASPSRTVNGQVGSERIFGPRPKPAAPIPARSGLTLPPGPQPVEVAPPRSAFPPEKATTNFQIPKIRMGRGELNEDQGIQEMMRNDLEQHGRTAYMENSRQKWAANTRQTPKGVLVEEAGGSVPQSPVKFTKTPGVKSAPIAPPPSDDLTGILTQSLEQAKKKRGLK